MDELSLEGSFGPRERIALYTFSGSVGLLATGLLHPIYSSLTRWRAHHIPLSSTHEHGPKGLWDLSKLFYKNHGWRGLFRGFGTSLLGSVITFATTLIGERLLSSVKLGSEGGPPNPTPSGWLILLAASVLALPFEVLAHRMMIYGGKVGTLMTFEEKAKPVKNIYTPSLILAGCTSVLVEASCSFIEASLAPRTPLEKPSRTAALLRAAVVAIIGTVFNVIFARLSASPLASINEHKVSRPGRPEVEHYSGFLDCVQRTVKEEGIGALFRGWYFEVAAAVFQASAIL